ncbi:homoserine O-succinyltransferase [Aliidiomarina halalkaliphila]|uniref:Homoserine O-succinyltransferase n=1 Tax=Aliidiomarina halalkaliphila TaxID=2593535 RepID=A0A552X391_9GAMM|nr:homoserine O-succinyltransferase [Aliidiomarina halalkaliphila]TRW49518.1 homoserine O-succinyltransferase [Aliidiomarina halalkaliphila]
MPVILHRALPVIQTLQDEGLDIRFAPHERGAIKLGFLNLMPEKESTERHWLRLLARTGLSIEVHLLKLKQWTPKTTSPQHMERYYEDWDSRIDLDGLMITGAPLGKFDYEQVDYWHELRDIFDNASLDYNSVLYLCWAANAAFHHHYGIPRAQRSHKLSGVYEHRVMRKHPITASIHRDVKFPHSRYAEARQNQLYAHPELRVLVDSRKAGAFAVVDPVRKRLFILGHPEYEADTLHLEFERDKSNGKEPLPPEYYYENDEPGALPSPDWQAHGAATLKNWIEHWVG